MSRSPVKRVFTLGNIMRNPADEVQTELAFHFDETVAELRAAGYSEQDAREEARRRFGDYATYRDELERLTRRRVTVSKLLERWSAIFKDLQYAARSLIRARGFTGSVVFTLAIGIGATSLMFSLVNGVILDPLPFPDSGRLVRVFDTQIERGRLSSTSSPANFVDWREQQSVFSDLAAYTNGRATFTDLQPAENLVTANVSSEWFQVLGVLPLLGRGFTRDEEVWGNHNVVVVSHAFWLNYLQADSAVVGRTIGLEGTAQTVVGVMPSGFAFPAQDVQLWRPLAFDFEVSTARGVHYLSVIARLAPGGSLDRAQAGMDLLMVQLHDAYPEQLEGWGV